MERRLIDLFRPLTFRDSHLMLCSEADSLCVYIQYVTLKGLHWAKILKAFINQKLGCVIHRACIFDDVNKYETKIKKTAFWVRKKQT